MSELQTIVVIDSGFGGLAVVAALDSRASRSKKPEGDSKDEQALRITYVNAAPSDEVGFNQLPTHADKIRTLEKVVARVKEQEKPSGLYIACNTLSVLLPETHLADDTSVHGIPRVGAALLADFLRQHPTLPVLLFATQTTVSTDLYRKQIEAMGEDSSRVHQVACPRLETLISNDPTGSEVELALREFASDGLKFMGHPESLGVFLGCTHYGYRAPLFTSVIAELGSRAILLNPNAAFAALIAEEIGRPFNSTEVKFVTGYVPPEGEMDNVPRLLEPLSSVTADAVRNFHLDVQLHGL